MTKSVTDNLTISTGHVLYVAQDIYDNKSHLPTVSSLSIDSHIPSPVCLHPRAGTQGGEHLRYVCITSTVEAFVASEEEQVRQVCDACARCI